MTELEPHYAASSTAKTPRLPPAEDPAGARGVTNFPEASSAAGSANGCAPYGCGAEAHKPLDDTAESLPDTAATLADEFSRKAAAAMLAQRSQEQRAQARLDRIKSRFNATEEERTEQMREMNALRDMALAQAKVESEFLKKYIAMIAP